MTRPPAPRIHLLCARDAPEVVVLARGPAKVWRVFRWQTRRNVLEAGSTFYGRIYELRSDLSPDGRWMVYMGLGRKAHHAWTGLCQSPWLKTTFHRDMMSTHCGGGWFPDRGHLHFNVGTTDEENASLARLAGLHRVTGQECVRAGDEMVLYPRLERDGFVRQGEMPKEIRIEPAVYETRVDDDPGWLRKGPVGGMPDLRLRYLGYREGYRYRFDLPDRPDFLGDDVTWANFDGDGALVLARQGRIERWTPAAMAAQSSPTIFDLNLVVDTEAT